jgi:hypothetical protein
MARAQAASTQHVSDNDTTCMRRCRQGEAMRHSAGTAGKAGLRGRQGRKYTRRGRGFSLVPATQQGRYAAHHLTGTSPQCASPQSVPWKNEPKSSPARAWQHRERPGVRERAIAMCCHVVAMCCCHVPCLCNALAMLLPCYCHVLLAMLMQCPCHVMCHVIVVIRMS